MTPQAGQGQRQAQEAARGAAWILKTGSRMRARGRRLPAAPGHDVKAVRL